MLLGKVIELSAATLKIGGDSDGGFGQDRAAVLARDFVLGGLGKTVGILASEVVFCRVQPHLRPLADQTEAVDLRDVENPFAFGVDQQDVEVGVGFAVEAERLQVFDAHEGRGLAETDSELDQLKQFGP